VLVVDKPSGALKDPSAMEPPGMLRAKPDATFNRYLVAVICAAIAGVICAAVLGGARRDHFAALPLNGDYSWYLNFSGRHVPEIQDLDLFYHNIGHSIDEASKADIVLLGPSFVAYALDPELLQQFGERHGIKIYNMAFIGIRSGEFSRQVIKRWGLHPKLWIINVDDQFAHFFSPSMDMSIGPQTTPIAAVKYGRLRGWLAVASRNVRWRVENWWASWSTGAEQPKLLEIYRRPDDGSAHLGVNPRYYAADNGVVPIDRDQNCHSDAKTIALGRDYLRDIGGRSVFMLVPHSQYCPQQARELAEALGVEALLTPDSAYASVDGGGHLDQRGAVAFTTFLLSDLERSDAFKRIAPDH
jgi:cellobiose-specific phosphotransferase system component IIB